MQVYEVAVDGKTNKPSATGSAVVAPAPVTEGGRNQLRAGAPASQERPKEVVIATARSPGRRYQILLVLGHWRAQSLQRTAAPPNAPPPNASPGWRLLPAAKHHKQLDIFDLKKLFFCLLYAPLGGPYVGRFNHRWTTPSRRHDAAGCVVA